MEKNILSTLSNEEKKLLIVRTLKKGDILFRESETCSSISIVVSGEVKISSISFHGKELVFNTLKKNEIFGNNLIFSSEPFYKGDVTIVKNSTIVFISKTNLLKLLQSNMNFLEQYLSIQSNFGKKLNSTIKMLSYTSAEERFKYFLFENNGEISFKTISELAERLQMQRETLSRLITKLEKKNEIIRSFHKINSLN